MFSYCSAFFFFTTNFSYIKPWPPLHLSHTPTQRRGSLPPNTSSLTQHLLPWQHLLLHLLCSLLYTVKLKFSPSAAAAETVPVPQFHTYKVLCDSFLQNTNKQRHKHSCRQKKKNPKPKVTSLLQNLDRLWAPGTVRFLSICLWFHCSTCELRL